MTIDRVIKREQAKAEEYRTMSSEGNAEIAEINIRCSKYHEQLAEWLELLKWYQQGMEDIPSESGVLPKDVYRAGYIKAIDDFLEKIQWEYLNSCGIKQQEIDFLIAVSSQVAEQLKAGGTNVNNE